MHRLLWRDRHNMVGLPPHMNETRPEGGFWIEKCWGQTPALCGLALVPRNSAPFARNFDPIQWLDERIREFGGVSLHSQGSSRGSPRPRRFSGEATWRTWSIR